MPVIDTLDSLLKHELKDLYSAETQIIEALPKLIAAASNEELKDALQDHLDITEDQKERLEEIQLLLGEENPVVEKRGFFANLFKSNEGEEHCKAMEGLVKEADALLKEDMTPEVMDAAIIAAAQKMEHYEISSYGTARAYALQLNFTKVAELLSQTLDEEYYADDSLTALALSKVNLDAEPGTQKRGRTGSAKKVAAKKSAPKKAIAKKAAPKKPVAKKASSKKQAVKKQAPKKGKATAPKKSSARSKRK